MSDDFAFDDFDEEPLAGEPPKKTAPSAPVRPPQRPATPVPPAAQKAVAPPPIVPAAKEEPGFDFEDDFAAADYSSKATDTKQKPLKAPGPRRSPRSLLLLLLLLLVAGAGYYFLVFLPAQEAPAPEPVAQKPMGKPVPPPPVAQSVPPKPAQTAAQSQAAPAAPPQPAATPVASAPKPAAPVTSPVAAGKPEATTAAPVPQPPPATAKPTPVPATPSKPAPVPAAQPVAKTPPTPALSGVFQLRCGPFAQRENLLAAEKKVRQMGYEPRVSTVKRPTAMVRLRVGNYPPQEAEARRAELATRYPGAFLVAREDQRVLYAGSFHNLDEARRLADRLYQDGIRTEEEAAKVNIPLKLVSFGDFADRAAAEQAAGQARTAGLEVEIAGR